jgi:hypothetical protein
MKKILFVLLALTTLHTSDCFSQEESKRYIRKGLIRDQGTIAPGLLLKDNLSTISLYGTLEYYVADNVSVRGDGYYGLQIDEPTYLMLPGPIPSFLSSNHQLYAGVSYHFTTKGHLDPYLAFEPGVAFSQSVIGIHPNGDYLYSKTSANPLLSPALGFNFYFQRVFHLFCEARYIQGNHLSDAPVSLSLNELRFAFGLGLNLNLLKKKKIEG